MNELIPTAEEERLLGILHNEWWQHHAAKRQIPPVSVLSASLTPSGISCMLTLEGKSELEVLVKAIPRIRAMLDVEDGTMTSISPGGRGSVVRLSIRTRLVTDTLDMHWHPGITSFGIDTVTGEEVFVPPETHMLFSGTTGSGKSWSMRPLMASAVVSGKWDVYFADAKGDEANIWESVVHTANTPDAIADLFMMVSEKFAKNTEIMKRAGVSKWNDDLGNRTLLVADEGREVLNFLTDADERKKMIDKEMGEFDPTEPSLRRRAVNISALARSKGIIMLWGTQYPIVSEGKSGSGGLDNGINPNLTFRFSLRVASKQHAQQALEDTVRYPAHEIPETLRGHGYRAGHAGNLIRTWTVTDEMVRNLKDRPMLPRALPLGPGEKITSFTPYDAARLALRKGGRWNADSLARELNCTSATAERLLESFLRNGEAERIEGHFAYKSPDR